MQFSFENLNTNNFYRSETPQLEIYAIRNGLKISLGDNIFIEANRRVPLKQIQNKKVLLRKYILLSKKPKTFGIGPLHSPQLEIEIRQNLEKISLRGNILIEVNRRVPLKQIQNKKSTSQEINFTFQKTQNFWNQTTRQPPT